VILTASLLSRLAHSLVIGLPGGPIHSMIAESPQWKTRFCILRLSSRLPPQPQNVSRIEMLWQPKGLQQAVKTPKMHCTLHKELRTLPPWSSAAHSAEFDSACYLECDLTPHGPSVARYDVERDGLARRVRAQ
jgi:hypothetical protein